MAAPDAPAAPLDAAIAKARAGIATWNTCCRQHDNECVCGAWPMEDALISLLAALDADKRLEEAEAALREISAECTEPPFMGDGSLVSARRIKGMCDRYFARREGAAVRGEAGGPNA